MPSSWAFSSGTNDTGLIKGGERLGRGGGVRHSQFIILHFKKWKMNCQLMICSTTCHGIKCNKAQFIRLTWRTALSVFYFIWLYFNGEWMEQWYPGYQSFWTESKPNGSGVLKCSILSQELLFIMWSRLYFQHFADREMHLRQPGIGM